jgi:hypothetical protein
MADFKPKGWKPVQQDGGAFRPKGWTPTEEPAPEPLGDSLAPVRRAALGLAVGGLPGAVAGAMGLGEDVYDPGSDTRATALGFSQGGTFGFADEIGGAIGEALLPESGVKLGAGAAPSPSDTPEQRAAKEALAQGVASTPRNYDLVRDNMRGELKQAKEDSPWLVGGGQLAGAVAASVATRRVPGMAQLGPTGQAALEGAVEGMGESTSDSALGVAGDALMGGVVGGAFGKAGQVAGEAVSPLLKRGAAALQEGLAETAAERALKAAGAIQKDFPKQPGARGRFMERGALMLDEPGLVSAGRSAGGIGEAAEESLEEYGAQIGRYLKQAEDAGVAFDPTAFVQRVRAEVLPQVERNPALKSQRARIVELLNDFEAQAAENARVGQPFTFTEANGIKGDLQAAVFNNQGDIKRNQELGAAIQGIFTSEIDTQLGRVLEGDDLIRFLDAKKRYAAMATAAQLGRQGANRSTGNNLLGLPDYFASTAAAAMGGGPLGAAAAGAGASAIRGRADSVAAVGLKEMSDSDLLAYFANNAPEELGEYGAQIASAMQRTLNGDKRALEVTDYLLQQTDPAYREKKAQLRESKR